MNLEALLAPGGIAVTGASANPHKVGHALLANLVEGGFGGQVVPVNPKCKTLLGLVCHPSLEAFKQAGGAVPDLCLVAVPAPLVESAVSDAASSGVKAVVVVSTGFKEIGGEGAEREERLRQICTERDVRLLGPRSLGVINAHHAMNASYARYMPRPGDISVLSDSGAVCTAIIDWARARHLGLSKVVSLGNKSDLDEVDFLDLFARDDQTRVVIGYLEALRSGPRFLRAARALAMEKPVVLFRAGTTVSGSAAVRHHIGLTPGEDLGWAAALKQAGVIRAEGLDTLFDYATALVMQPLTAGEGVAVVSNAGGPGVVAADAIERADLRLTELRPETLEGLRAKLPPTASPFNPIDVLGDADPARFAQAVEAVQADPGVDAVLVLLAPHAMTRPAETAQAVARARRAGKPVLVTVLGSADVMPGREALVKAGLPDYPSPERAVQALKAMRDYALWQKRPPRVVTRFAVNRRRVERLILRHVRTGQAHVGEVAAKQMLLAYDFAVPAGRFVHDPREAVDAAERIGYPVAMKVVSPDIVHKSDVGGVKLDLSGPGQVEDAFDLLTLRVQRKAPRARLEGLYLERMSPRGVEVVAGMRRDALFGPVMLFGLGGIFVETLEDDAAHLAPITAQEARQMLVSTRSYKRWQEARGAEDLDLDAIAQAVQRLSQLASDFSRIGEIEINPLIVRTDGGDPVVVDARISLTQEARR